MMKKYVSLCFAASVVLLGACSKENKEKEVGAMKTVKTLPSHQAASEVSLLSSAPVAVAVPQATVPAETLALPSVTAGQHEMAKYKECRATTDSEIAQLFDRWNASLKTGKADMVANNYAPDSILLPTVSNVVRHTVAEKVDYFNHFLENQPVGEINERYIKIGCNSAIDAGVYTFHFKKTDKSVQGRYTFTYEWYADKNKWLITSHHSSVMPERAAQEQAVAREQVVVPKKAEH